MIFISVPTFYFSSKNIFISVNSSLSFISFCTFPPNHPNLFFFFSSSFLEFILHASEILNFSPLLLSLSFSISSLPLYLRTLLFIFSAVPHTNYVVGFLSIGSNNLYKFSPSCLLYGIPIIFTYSHCF